MAKISVVINTINEGKNISSAIKSVKKFADEIVVVDMKSDDDTVNIAKKLDAKVYSHKRTGYVEPARNFAIQKATGDWIFILDADEQVPTGLGKKLKGIAKDKRSADYYAVPRKNKIFSKWMQHSRWWPDYNIRFFKKGSVVWSDTIHGVPETHGTGADLPAKEKYAIIHEHYTDLEQYIARMNRYTTIQANNKKQEGYEFAWQDLITKPANEFFSRYFAGYGYKDGLHGLALSSLQAFSELVLYLKTWQKEDFKPQDLQVGSVIKVQKKSVKDLNYWQADTLGGFVNLLKRKFKLP